MPQNNRTDWSPAAVLNDVGALGTVGAVRSREFVPAGSKSVDVSRANDI